MLKAGPLLVMTPDLKVARGFYGETLGLPVRAEYGDQLVFGLGQADLHVFRCEDAAPASHHGRNAASVIAFEVASMAEAMAVLKARGVRFLHQAPATNADCGWRYAAFEAPGGLVHELVERR